jgi:predicted transposase/invertase (TIGR01784 family)
MVLRAMEELKNLSRNETDKYRALAREKALRDEISLYNQAIREGLEKGRQEGEQIGIQKGEQIGMEKGRKEASRRFAVQLFGLNLGDAQIAAMTGLSEAEVAALRKEAL